MSACPPVAFPPPPPTANTLSSHQRAALVRSSKKLSKILGDVPRVPDDDIPPRPPPSVELTRTRTTPVPRDTGPPWRRRKPAHVPPPLKLSGTSSDAPHALDSPGSLTSPVYHRPPACRDSVLSVAPSSVSNCPSTSCESSFPDALPTDAGQRRAKLERLRHKLGPDVPATAVFPTSYTPPTPKSSTPLALGARTRSFATLPGQTDDVRSVTFSISSDESTHAVTFTAAHMRSPAHPHKTKHVYQTGPLPPVPPIPAHLVPASTSSSRRGADDDDTGLIRPRRKMAAGSKIGGSDFKAARRAKREGKPLHGMAEPGEMVEMVGFMW